MNKIMKRILPLVLLLSLSVTSFLGCSQSETETIRIGGAAPDFELEDLNGQSLSLSDFRGSPVLITFWASSCGSCTYQMPYVQEIWDAGSARNPVVLAINLGEEASEVEEFMGRYNYSLPVLLDGRRTVARKYGIRYIPTNFFIDEDGILEFVKVGPFMSKAEIENMLSQMKL